MPPLLLLLSLTVVLGWLICLALGTRFLLQAPKLSLKRKFPLPNPPPFVSILLAARNEEKNIENCLQSLLASDYPNFEILVYEDLSTDNTRVKIEAIASQESRVKLFVGKEEPPLGWAGKPHAMVQLIERSDPKGDIWLLTDADTVHNPEGLRRTVSFLLESKIDHLTVWPRRLAQSFWEKLVPGAIWDTILFASNLLKSNTSNRAQDAVGNGQYFLVRPEAYLSVGGHRAICSSFSEDLDLAYVIRAGGYKSLFAMGYKIFSGKMYGSLAEIIEGWTKYFFPWLRRSLSRTILVIPCMLLLTFIPTVFLLESLFVGGIGIKIYGLTQYLFCVGAMAAFRLRGAGYPLYAILEPLGALIAAFILVRSAIFNLRGLPMGWKGRRHIPDTRGFL